jgi:hypothetical protein
MSIRPNATDGASGDSIFAEYDLALTGAELCRAACNNLHLPYDRDLRLKCGFRWISIDRPIFSQNLNTNNEIIIVRRHNSVARAPTRDDIRPSRIPPDPERIPPDQFPIPQVSVSRRQTPDQSIIIWKFTLVIQGEYSGQVNPSNHNQEISRNIDWDVYSRYSRRVPKNSIA